MRVGRGLLAAAAVLLCAPAGVAAAAPEPFGHPCAPFAGVRLCATPSPDARVPTFDGVPQQVDVTLPATGDGPFPTVVILHGLGSNKSEFETSDPEGGHHLTNVRYAKQGYAAVNVDLRGFGESCGTVESRGPRCDRGWFHLADQRYEVRDVQDLLGRLVDEGTADPRALGAAGCSYGSVITLQLALLRDRIRTTDGAYAPWRSPAGRPLSLAAGYAQCSISSWIATLGPNGRLLDFTDPSATQDREPVGVLKASVVAGALALLNARGLQVPPLLDPTADFFTWASSAVADPSDGPTLKRTIDELSAYHQAMGISLEGTTPAPLLVHNGWADDYTPAAAGGLRLYRYLRARDPDADIALQLTDWGHPRSSQLKADGILQHDQALAFFDHHLKGVGKAPAPGSVTALTQRCPTSAPSLGPFTAPSWHALHPGEVRFGDAGTRTITELTSDPVLDAQTDPVAATPCASMPVRDAPGVPVHRHRVSTPFTVLGLPTVDLDVTSTGRYGRIIARLWDEAPDGTQQLVTRGVYRLTPGQSGAVTFQLFGGGWRYETGHTARLELLGGDAPFFKPAEQSFTATISNVRISLPTHEKPDGGDIRPPSHLPAERCRSSVTFRVRRTARSIVVRSGRRVRTLRGVRPRTLVVPVTGRRATVRIRYRSGHVRTFARSLCSRV